MSDRCPNCPIAEGYCRGFEVRRFCTLLDPDGPKYRPEYKSAVIEQTAQFDPDRTQEYPPYVAQVGNLFRSALRFVRSGFKLTPKKERQARLEVCLGCDQYDQAQKRCRKCGCVNSAKVWVASDKCPLGKWPSL
jgi:hypothetical protein